MEGALAAMFNTITDIAKVDVDTSLTRVMEIEGTAGWRRIQTKNEETKPPVFW